MFTERTSVGLDVHARSVAAAAIDGVTGELFQAKLPPGNDWILEWVRGVPGPVAVASRLVQRGSGCIELSRARGFDAWSQRRRSCSALRAIG